jgi:hypothetical protein
MSTSFAGVAHIPVVKLFFTDALAAGTVADYHHELTVPWDFLTPFISGLL